MRSPLKSHWIWVGVISLSMFAVGGYCKSTNQCPPINQKTVVGALQFIAIFGVTGALLWRGAQYQPHLQNLSTQDAEILRIASDGELETTEIYKALSQAGIAPSASGDIPPLLSRLEGLKLLASRWDKETDESGMRRKYYKTTRAGNALLKSLVQRKPPVKRG